MSGKSIKGRPELERASDELGTGDILFVAEWDRATRSMFDGIEIIKRIHARNAYMKVLDKPHHAAGPRFHRLLEGHGRG